VENWIARITQEDSLIVDSDLTLSAHLQRARAQTLPKKDLSAGAFEFSSGWRVFSFPLFLGAFTLPTATLEWWKIAWQRTDKFFKIRANIFLRGQRINVVHLFCRDVSEISHLYFKSDITEKINKFSRKGKNYFFNLTENYWPIK